jgi:triosephosphate isomerase
MRQLVAGNWKMNGTGASLAEIEAVARAVVAGKAACDVMICPPATLIAPAVAAASDRIEIGGQNCHAQVSGAFTGDISAEMLKDAGASAVIVGHSERRQYHGETDEMVAAKAKAAWRAGLLAIICIGETEAEHSEGKTFHVCRRQLAGSVPADAKAATTCIAYEPIWAIGTGKTPTSQQIANVHAHIREELIAQLGAEGNEMRILYGGSVKAANAREILALENVGGALVGGASLKAADFQPIFMAAAAKS